jgi:hypothetical protein
MKTKRAGDYNACMIVMPSQTKHLPQQKQKLKRLNPEKLEISFLTKQTTVQPHNLFKPKQTNKQTNKNKEIATFAQNTYCKGLVLRFLIITWTMHGSGAGQCTGWSISVCSNGCGNGLNSSMCLTPFSRAESWCSKPLTPFTPLALFQSPSPSCNNFLIQSSASW